MINATTLSPLQFQTLAEFKVWESGNLRIESKSAYSMELVEKRGERHGKNTGPEETCGYRPRHADLAMR